MRKLTFTLILITLGLLTLSMAGVITTLITGRAGWLWLLPTGLLASLVLLVGLGLHGSRGGLVALLRGQFPPRQGEIERKIHQAAGDSSCTTHAEAFVDLSHPAAQVSDRFLSVAIDLSQVVGGKWWDPAADHIELSSGSLKSPVFDFNRPQLDRLTSALAPLYLRAGGSEADKIFYNLDDDPTIPPGYQSVLIRSQWEAIQAFCARNGCELIFTLNAGPAARRTGGGWDPTNAEALMRYASSQGQRVYAWELGNELNAYFVVHGLKHQVSVAQYCRDLQLLRYLRDKYSPAALLAGQGSAYVPVLGEMLGSFFGFSAEMLKMVGHSLDCFTWHYYPQQSRRCPMGTRRAHPARLLDPAYLDEAAHWAREINQLRDRYAPGLPTWLGETGNAQCGGEPGLSDTYLAGLWWLDELGLMASLGQQVVVRQSLTGMNYGLLDEASLSPRPDYWNSLLWRRLMGQTVYPLQVNGPRTLRAYGHTCARGDGISIVMINLDKQKPTCISLPQFAGRTVEQYLCTAPDVLGDRVLLNERLLSLDPNGQLPATPGVVIQVEEGLHLPPLSYGFYILNS